MCSVLKKKKMLTLIITQLPGTGFSMRLVLGETGITHRRLVISAVGALVLHTGRYLRKGSCLTLTRLREIKACRSTGSCRRARCCSGFLEGLAVAQPFRTAEEMVTGDSQHSLVGRSPFPQRSPSVYPVASKCRLIFHLSIQLLSVLSKGATKI